MYKETTASQDFGSNEPDDRLSQKLSYKDYSEEELEDMYLRFYYGDDYIHDSTETAMKGPDRVKSNDRTDKTNDELSKRFSCQYCNYSCNREGNLNRHLNSVHDEIDYFRCNYCHFSAPQNRSIMIHEKIAHRRKYTLHIRKKSSNLVNKRVPKQLNQFQNESEITTLNMKKIRLPSKCSKSEATLKKNHNEKTIGGMTTSICENKSTKQVKLKISQKLSPGQTLTLKSSERYYPTCRKGDLKKHTDKSYQNND